MARRSNCLPLLVLASVSIILLLSCTQSEDVVTPVSTTDLVLKAERLPSPPAGMVYELWVTKGNDTTSVGKFSYDVNNEAFLTPAGAVRSDTFSLTGDILAYSQILVSIELANDPDPAHAGPIMLVDDVTLPDDNPIRLRFPNADSLWAATCKVNLETPSDLDRNAGVGSGVWFSRYATLNVSIPDTVGMSWEIVDSVLPDDPNRTSFRYQCNVSDTGYTLLTINFGSSEYLWMGDSLPKHRGVTYHLDECVDSEPPFSGQVPKPTFNTQAHVYTIDWFNQAEFLLPVVTQFGWHYKGWVITPYEDPAMTTHWRLTPPGYRYNTANYKLIPGDTGTMFTTGTFAHIELPDDADPFTLGDPSKRPPFPGEDFLNTAALRAVYGIDSINFMPFATNNVGTVFITLEPDNFNSDTTNFPLLVLIRPLPSARNAVTGNNVQLDMTNYTSTIAGNSVGFPEIDISLKRF